MPSFPTPSFLDQLLCLSKGRCPCHWTSNEMLRVICAKVSIVSKSVGNVVQRGARPFAVNGESIRRFSWMLVLPICLSMMPSLQCHVFDPKNVQDIIYYTLLFYWRDLQVASIGCIYNETDKRFYQSVEGDGGASSLRINDQLVLLMIETWSHNVWRKSTAKGVEIGEGRNI